MLDYESSDLGQTMLVYFTEISDSYILIGISERKEEPNRRHEELLISQIIYKQESHSVHAVTYVANRISKVLLALLCQKDGHLHCDRLLLYILIIVLQNTDKRRQESICRVGCAETLHK